MNWDIRGNKRIIVQGTGNKGFESFLGDDRFEVFRLGLKKAPRKIKINTKIESVNIKTDSNPK